MESDVLMPPSWVRAIARRAVDVEVANAVAHGGMTPGMWVEARESLTESGDTVWGVVLGAPTVKGFWRSPMRLLVKWSKIIMEGLKAKL